MKAETSRKKDQPWVFRTYSGHSSARASNELFKSNLQKGQTGLSIAFDLPTQMGYDADHTLARGEVGKVGVPVSSIEDMEILFEGIPLDKMNTSMTINATAAWLLALYIATAERHGVNPKTLSGTTQNDIIKEYLSRGTYVYPPKPSIRLICDMIAYTVDNNPRWNPINICSYHLQEAGATPTQEIAYAFANAITILDEVQSFRNVDRATLSKIFSRISFFLNSGIRFVDEVCKVRAMAALWDEIGIDRYGVETSKDRRFRYGVQVNSLGLTEAQPENNMIRIVLESLGVTLSKKARCRALQLPAWNEALGLPRPWDQQWSLRTQQILAYETDLLEHEDLFEGSYVIEERTTALLDGARAELAVVLGMGGAITAIENSYMKRHLVESHTARMLAIENGDISVVGANIFTNSEASPLLSDSQHYLKVDESSERAQIESIRSVRSRRNQNQAQDALKRLTEAARTGENIMPASISCAHAMVTTGEWADALREVFGEYRAATGVTGGRPKISKTSIDTVQRRVIEVSQGLGRPLKLLVGKPGLDGHSNGAEQIAVRARDVGMEVIYEGIRLTPEEIATSARDEGVHIIGLSVLSGSHCVLVLDVMEKLRELGLGNLPVVVGGIIPEQDALDLCEAGVKQVYTPRDFDLQTIMEQIVDYVEDSHAG